MNFLKKKDIVSDTSPVSLPENYALDILFKDNVTLRILNNPEGSVIELLEVENSKDANFKISLNINSDEIYSLMGEGEYQRVNPSDIQIIRGKETDIGKPLLLLNNLCRRFR